MNDRMSDMDARIIPDKWVERAVVAIRKLERSHGVDGLWSGLNSDKVAGVALEAVFPEMVKEERERIAQAIEAEAGTYPHDSIVQVGFREAAAIARDASQETP